MRVAVWHNLPSGGGKRALHDHVRSLVGQGHHVEVWCPPTADESYLPLADLVPVHVVPLRGADTGHLSLVAQLLADRVDDVTAMEEHCAAAAGQIAAGGFDVLFANACMFFRTTPIGRMVDLPSVLYLPEPYRWLYEALPDPPWAAGTRPDGWWHSPRGLNTALAGGVWTRRRRIQVREEVRNAAAFGTILCNSLYSRESILRAYGLDSEVCYVGVDEQRLQPAPAAREDFFLTVGAAVEEKNVGFLVRSLARSAHRDWPLVWVTNVSDVISANQVRSAADAAGVTLDVRLRVGDDELLTLLRTARLFLYSPRLEPFGLAPLEAAACGLPSVVVAEAGTRETTLDGVTGRQTVADPAVFAGAVDALLADVPAYEEMSLRARAWVESTWTMAAAGGRLEAALQREIDRAARVAAG